MRAFQAEFRRIFVKFQDIIRKQLNELKQEVLVRVGSDGWGDHCTVSDVSITCTDSIGKKKSKTREVKGSGTCK